MSVRNKTMLIIGNGPSTKELVKLGFHNIPDTIDTFGMGHAFRYYASVNWWPTYFIYADIKVVTNDKAFFKELLLDKNVSVKKFFLPIEPVKSDRLEIIPHSSTGDFAFKKSIELGYEQILLIGIDLDYKPLKEATRITRGEYDALGLKLDYDKNFVYKVRRPVKDNPNYFFPEYQQVGDIYSEPRGNSWHQLSWQRAREFVEAKQISVRNLGACSLLEAFLKESLEVAFERTEIYPPLFPSQTPSKIAAKIYLAELAISHSYLKEIGELRKRIAELSQKNKSPESVRVERTAIEDSVLSPRLLLLRYSSALLTDPAKTLDRLANDNGLANRIDAALRQENELVIHYKRLLSNAQKQNE